METEKQMIEANFTNADCHETTKIKTPFARIIVGGTVEKPYYDILYFDPADRKYHAGFGSFCLEYVFKWLSEEFEIVEFNPEDAVDTAPVVHGQWVYSGEPDDDGNIQAHCSVCDAGDRHAPCMIGHVPYCWKCGAKMDGERKNK